MTASWRARCSAGVLAVAVACTAHALEEQGDRWSFFVGGGLTYDDNLLRLPNGVQPVEVGVGNRPLGTWIANGFARVLLDVPVSRQRFRLDLTANTYGFDAYSYLNWSGWNGRADWLWEAGNRWKGTASVARVQTLTSFADFRNFRTGNILTVDSVLVDADYWIHPNWRIVGAANYLRGRNNQAVLAFNDIDQYWVEAGVRYVSTAQNWLRPSVRYTHGEYPERPLLTLVSDSSFDQYDIGLDFLWRLSGASELTGRIAYTDRRYPNVAIRNFSGPTGRVNYSWLATGKTGVNLLLLREIGAVDDITATYIVTSSVAVTPYWLVTPKLRLEASYQWTNRDYAGQPVVLGIPQRDDVYNFARLGATWTPTRNWSVSLAYQFSDRTSNFPGQQFNDNLGTLTVQLAW
jgi:exopolysaccharide biosynthesis operon protein EpsL